MEKLKTMVETKMGYVEIEVMQPSGSWMLTFGYDCSVIIIITDNPLLSIVLLGYWKK